MKGSICHERVFIVTYETGGYDFYSRRGINLDNSGSLFSVVKDTPLMY